MTSVRLSEVIASVFFETWGHIKAHDFAHFWLKGGRNSTKSSFVSIAVVLLLISNPDANAVVFRKVANTLADSVYEQIAWACDIMGVAHLFHFSKSPLRITYKPTGQQIRFKGCDDPRRVKSQKFKRGYCAVVWFEEVDEFTSMEEIDQLLATFLRGGSTFWSFYTYNPPRSVRNWTNKEAKTITSEAGKGDRYIHHSTYLDIIDEHPDWVSEQAHLEAERAKEKRPDSYRHMWLGEVVGTGSEVFPDDLIEIRPITQEERDSFDCIGIGVDAGSVHPWVYEREAFDVDDRVLYIFDEESRTGSGAHDVKTCELLWKKLVDAGDESADIWCDSSARGMILYYQDNGLNARKAYKQGLNSPKERIAWMNRLTRIVIDPDAAPMAARQFPAYEYVTNGQGDISETLPKIDDDAIDAVGYAASPWIKGRY